MTTSSIGTRPRLDKTRVRPTAAPVERVEPRQPAPAPPQRPEPKPRRFPVPVFYTVPYDLLIDLPLQPRGGSDPNRLSCFEMQILFGLLTAARIAHSAAINAQAFQEAHPKIVEESRTGARFRANQQARERPFGKRNTRPRAIRQVGIEGYQARQQQLRQAGTERVPVAITRANLLAVAHANRHFGERLPAALDRLTEARPLAGLPPLLISGWRQHGRDLLIEVAGAWVDPLLNVRKVVAQLPVTSPTTLALFLFAGTVATDRSRRRSDAAAAITFDVLCKKLCMHPATPPSRCGAILDRALATVNAHLATLDRAALGKVRIYPPRSYQVQSVEDMQPWRYRFEYIPLNAGDDDDDEPDPVDVVPEVRPERRREPDIELDELEDMQRF